MKQYNLTEGSISKGILLFLLPLLASTLIQQLYSTVDLIFVGKFCGIKETAAIGASSLIITCLIGFFNGMAVGTNVVVAHIYGKKDKHELKKIIQTVFLTGIVGGLILTIAGVYYSPIFLRYMNTPESILPIAVRYLRIYLLSIIFIIIYNLFSGILRAMGNSKLPMLFQIICGFINVFADFIFIIVFKMGVDGAAIATLLSQTFAGILMLIYFYKYNIDAKLEFNFKNFSKKLLKKILTIGIPAGIQSIVITLSNIIIQSKINKFGVDVIAAYTAYFKIELILYIPIITLGQAIVSFVGQNYGANKLDRIKKGVKYSMIYSSIVIAILSSLMISGSSTLFKIFTDSAEVINYGRKIVSITFPFYFLYAVLECLSCLIRGKGKSIPPMIIIVLSFCGVRILFLMILLNKYNSPISIAMSYPVSWLVAVLFTFFYIKFTKYDIRIIVTIKNYINHIKKRI